MFFILMLTISCTKKPVYQVRAESPDYLTGLSYDKDMQIRYRLTSDDNYFYIRFDSERRDLRFQLMDKGLNLYIDTTLKQHPSFTLVYPIPASVEHHPLPEQKEISMRDHLPILKVKPIALLKTGDNIQQLNTDSVPFSGLFSVTEEAESGRFVYKAAIPWTNFPNGEKFRNGRPFMVGIELSKPVNGMVMRGMPDRKQGEGMPRRGEGTGREPGGGIPGGRITDNRQIGIEDGGFSQDGRQGMTPGGPAQQDRILTEPFTLWLAVTTLQIP